MVHCGLFEVELDKYLFSHQMPRIWLDYCQFLVSQCKITRSRRSFDRALRALPVTQHPRIWPLYLRFVRNLPLPETAIRVYRRYLKVRSSCITQSYTTAVLTFDWQLVEMVMYFYGFLVWCDRSNSMLLTMSKVSWKFPDSCPGVLRHWLF